jgi:hypothetical protein
VPRSRESWAQFYLDLTSRYGLISTRETFAVEEINDPSNESEEILVNSKTVPMLYWPSNLAKTDIRCDPISTLFSIRKGKKINGKDKLMLVIIEADF